MNFAQPASAAQIQNKSQWIDLLENKSQWTDLLESQGSLKFSSMESTK